MSEVKEKFLTAAKARSWNEAFWNLNGLNMFEMLRALDQLSSTLLDELLRNTTSFWSAYNIERISFAATVVRTNAIPTDVRGDLEKTGQVQDARNFIAARKKGKIETSSPATRSGQFFQTADQAAVAAIDEILPTSVANNWEYAGYIAQTTEGGFFYTQPMTIKSDQDSNSGPHSPNRVAAYHTHAGGFHDTDEEFSPRDKLKATLAKEMSYVGTPRGAILRFTPVDLLATEDQTTFPAGRVDVLRIATVLVLGKPEQ
jgi:hypothetical protein